MAEVANRSAPQHLPQESLLLAADVGGTHARVGLVSCRPDGASPVTMLRYQRYACAEWPSLTAVLQHFVTYLEAPAPIGQCVVASAGYVLVLTSFLVAPVAYPWYLVWALALVPLLEGTLGWAALVWSATAPVSYLVWQSNGWRLSGAATCAEYLPVYLLGG